MTILIGFWVLRPSLEHLLAVLWHGLGKDGEGILGNQFNCVQVCVDLQNI